MDFGQFKQAIMRLEEMISAYKGDRDDLPEVYRHAVQDSLVKRFGYTLEVAWKSCKRYLNEQGFSEAAAGSPKSIMRLAAEAGVIRSAAHWIRYIDARQSTSQDYSQAKAGDLLAIVDDFYEDATALYQTLSAESEK